MHNAMSGGRCPTVRLGSDFGTGPSQLARRLSARLAAVRSGCGVARYCAARPAAVRCQRSLGQPEKGDISTLPYCLPKRVAVLV